jgi:hypothetical protein
MGSHFREEFMSERTSKIVLVAKQVGKSMCDPTNLAFGAVLLFSAAAFHDIGVSAEKIRKDNINISVQDDKPKTPEQSQRQVNKLAIEP